MDDSGFAKLTPVTFFQFQFDCHQIEAQPLASLGKRLHQKKYLLPDLSELCDEEAFAEVYIGWAKEGLAVFMKVNEPFKKAYQPSVQKGDSLELFIDTRDVKTSGHNTRYCHHFFCLPEEVDGLQAGELTHFRTEDAHEWCNHEDFQVNCSLHATSYTMLFFIPAHCLHGYDPDNFDRMGFAYRINRAAGSSQHFCAVTKEFQIEQQPSLWCTLKLVS